VGHRGQIAQREAGGEVLMNVLDDGFQLSPG
jgi:hypothetical protein